MSDPPASEPWHLDRRVPIALILALIAQTAGMVWWAAELSTSVRDHDRRIALIESQASAAAAALAGIRGDIGVLVERQTATNRTLDRVERLLDSRTPATR